MTGGGRKVDGGNECDTLELIAGGGGGKGRGGRVETVV
jgi:hypothetical protein